MKRHKENKKLKQIRFTNKRRGSLLLGLLALVLVAAAIIIKLARPAGVPDWVPPFGHKPSPAPSVQSSPKPGGGLVKPQASPGATPDTRPTHGDPPKLIVSGSLISNHRISLTSSDPTLSPSENSTCQTAPSASCDVRLTGPDGTIKLLGAKTTDDQGGANFNWDAKNLGLTAGRWKVEAVAAGGGQNAVSAPDYLDIQP